MGSKGKKKNKSKLSMAASALGSAPVATFDQIEETLLGLVSIEIDDGFADPVDPQRVWVVLHLDLIRAKAYPRAVAAALKAVGSLCTLAQEAATRAEDLFWAKLVVSDLLRSPFLDQSELMAQKMRDSVQAHDVHLFLSWDQRPFQSVVATEIANFVQSPRAQYTTSVASASAIQFGVRLTQFELTEVILQQLAPMFNPPTAAEAPTLCSASVIQRLDLTGTSLNGAMLNTLADLVEHVRAKTVNHLILDGTLPASEAKTTSPEYVASFQRLLCRLTSQMTTASLSSNVAPLLLSLGHSTLSAELLEALHHVLTTATRPLLQLNLSDTFTSRPDGWKRLGRLLFSPLLCIDDCVLELAHLRNSQELTGSFLESLAELVTETLPEARRALADGVSVKCRLRESMAAPLPRVCYGAANKVKHKLLSKQTGLVELVNYTVVSVSTDNRIELSRIEIASDHSTMWVGAEAIASIQVGGQELVGFPFSGVVLDSSVEYHDGGTFLNGVHLESLMSAIGFNLRRLSLRGESQLDRAPRDMLQWCPHLEVLNLDNWVQYRRKWLWRDLDPLRFPCLQSLSISWPIVSRSEIESLQKWFASGGGQALRRLRLRCGNVKAVAFEILGEILSENPSVEVVDINWWRDPQDLDAEDAISKIQSQLEASPPRRVRWNECI